MKEEEAKKKWCPMFRIQRHTEREYQHYRGKETVITNRYNYGEKFSENARCIASDCMMWRKHYPEYKCNACGAENWGNKHGYCGLAK